MKWDGTMDIEEVLDFLVANDIRSVVVKSDGDMDGKWVHEGLFTKDNGQVVKVMIEDEGEVDFSDDDDDDYDDPCDEFEALDDQDEAEHQSEKE